MKHMTQALILRSSYLAVSKRQQLFLTTNQEAVLMYCAEQGG